MKEVSNEGTKKTHRNPHSGSAFDDFLEKEGIREVEAVAINRVLARQFEEEMKKQAEELAGNGSGASNQSVAPRSLA